MLFMLFLMYLFPLLCDVIIGATHIIHIFPSSMKSYTEVTVKDFWNSQLFPHAKLFSKHESTCSSYTFLSVIAHCLNIPSLSLLLISKKRLEKIHLHDPE
jgi:hypothetical protein